MAGAANVGGLIISMSADVATLKTNMADGVRIIETSSKKMGSDLASIRDGLTNALAPLESLTVKVGSLESNMAKAQGAAISLAKGLILGAAAGASIDAITKKILGVIDSMSSLKTISEKTGSSVENLSKLSFFAKQSGSDIDSISAALAKMSKGMAGADNETKGAGLALSFLGISAKDASGNLKDPAAMFSEVAKKLGEYKDGAGKAAIAQALFGKAGADMLPTLKLMAEQGDIAAKVTDEQATAARQYTRDMAKLDAQQGMVFKTIAVAILPAMSDFAEAMSDVIKNVNMTNDAVKGLADDGSLTSWADDAAVGVARLVDVIILIPRILSAVASSFKVVFTDIALLASNNPAAMAYKLTQGRNPLDEMAKDIADREKLLTSANKKFDDLWNKPANQMEQAVINRIAGRNTASENSLDAVSALMLGKGGAKKDLNYNTSGEDGDKSSGAKAAAALAAANKTAMEANLNNIKSALEIEKAMRSEWLASVVELNREGIVSDGEMQAAKVASALMAGTDVARIKQAEIDVLTKYHAKDVAEQNTVNGKIANLNTEKNEALRASLAVADALRTKYIFDSGKAERDAQAAADSEVNAANKQTATLKEQYDTYNMLPAAITAVTIAKLQAKTAALEMNEGTEAEINNNNRLIVSLQSLASAQAQTGTAQLAAENKKFSAESIVNERDRAHALLEIDADKWRQVIAAAGEGTEAQKKLQSEFDIWYLNQSLKPQIDAQKSMWASINQTAHDTFINIFNGGKNAFDRLRDTLKSGLLDMLYQMTVKKWIFNISASVNGGASGIAGIANTAQAVAGGGSGLIGAANTASSIYSMAGIGSTITAAGNLFGSAAVSSFGTGLSLGTAATTEAVAAYVAAGETVVASSLSAGAAISTGITTALAAVPVWGWVALAGLAAVSYFGNGPESDTRLKFGSNNAAGAISINERGNEGKSDNYISNSSKSALGTFGITSTFWMDSGQATVQEFIKTVGQTDDALSAFMTTTEKAAVSARLTGVTDTIHTGEEGSNPNASGQLDSVFRNRIHNIMEGIDTGLSSLTDGFAGNSQALATEAAALLQYRVALKDSGEAVFGVKVTMQQLAALKLPTEATSAALTRLASEFSATNQVASMFGVASEQAFGAVGLASAAARENLILLSGGISAMGSKTAAFANNYLTDAERLAPVAKAVGAAMESLGLASVTTREQFKDAVLGLVSSGAVATEAGAAQYASLMNLQDAFAQVHPAVEATTVALKNDMDALSERKSLQDQLDAATMTTAELADKARNAIDGSNLALYDQVQAATKAKDALSERKSLQDQLDAATMTTAELADKARNAIDGSNLALYDQVQAATKAKTAADTLAASLKTAADALIATNAGYQKQIDAQIRITLSKSAQRAADIAGMDPTTVAQYDKLQAVTAVAVAFSAAANTAAAGLSNAVNTLATTNAGLQTQIDAALRSSMSAADAYALDTAGKDASTVALMGELTAANNLTVAKTAANTAAATAATASQTAVTTAQTNLNSAYSAAQSTIQGTINKLSSFATTMMNFRDGLALGAQSPLTPAQQYDTARGQFNATLAAAKSGDENAQSNLQSAATAFLTASRTANASDQQYTADFNLVQSSISGMASWAQAQVSVAQASLTALNAQVAGLNTVNNSVLSVAAAITALARAQANVIASPAPAPVMSVADAQAAYNTAHANVLANPTPAGAAVLTGNAATADSLYMSLLGRHAEAEGLMNATAYLNSGTGLPIDLANMITHSAEYLGLHGSHASGLAYVPFDGYRAELHKGEQVLTAGDAMNYKSMGTAGMAPLVAEIKALRAEVSQLRADQNRQTGAIIDGNNRAHDRASSKAVDGSVKMARDAAWAAEQAKRTVV